MTWRAPSTGPYSKEAKKLGVGNAGKNWFNMQAVEYTPELRRDMRQGLADIARHVIDTRFEPSFRTLNGIPKTW